MVDSPQQKLLAYLRNRVTLTPADEQLITETYQVKHLARKEYFMEQGTACIREGFVADGAFRVFYTDDKGLEHVLYFAFEDWWVGDPGSFSDADQSRFTIQAIRESTLLFVNREQKEKLYTRIPALERVFRIIIQKHLAVMQKRFLLTVSAVASERYAELLERCPDIEQLVPQHQIASYLGILPESLSRMKKDLFKRH